VNEQTALRLASLQKEEAPILFGYSLLALEVEAALMEELQKIPLEIGALRVLRDEE